MVVLALSSVRPSHADGVCGDDVMDDGEMCDDGNLVGGDGCSAACQIEDCSNGIVDVGEQCDDGNGAGGDGCSSSCQIEFCGDKSVQISLGEQCDDGNGISGDGCSSACQPESAIVPADSVQQAPEKKEKEEDQSDVYVPPVTTVAQTEAAVAAKFLSSPSGEDVKQHLSREESLQLETIVQKLQSGRRLTAQEREWAEALFVKLEEAKVAERERYTDLLRQFIATPISSDVVDEKNLQKNRLVNVRVPVAIDELKRAVAVIQRGELQQQATLNVGLLHRQGIAIETDVPVGYESYLTPATRPIQVFTTLKALKEASEKYATNDLPASLSVIRSEAAEIAQALPIFEREYGIDTDEAKVLLADITSVSDDVTKQDAYRVVSAINRFLSMLQRDKVLTSAELGIVSAPHAAAGVVRISEEIGDPAMTTDIKDIPAFIDRMSLQAPAEYKEIFQNGAIELQRRALLDFLKTDEKIPELFALLPGERKSEFIDRFTQLKRAVADSGDDRDADTVCDDSMPESLLCTAQFLAELQDAVRSQSYFSRLIGTLQDYFGIEQ